MSNTKTLKKPTKDIESIFEAEHRIKNEAKEIAKNFIHKKTIKYLLK
jgi:hypothetical protein